MKLHSEKRALKKLQLLKSDFAKQIRNGYEHRAKDCLTCETQGACCLDAHFVNVHITHLEAVAIGNTIGKLPKERQSEIYSRIERTIEQYNLSDEGETFSQTYACPLFEKDTGCLVHSEGKPLPCIAHACYERKEDLPPEDLLTEQEGRVEKLNERVYARLAKWLPLPVAVIRTNRSFSTSHPESSSELAMR